MAVKFMLSFLTALMVIFVMSGAAQARSMSVTSTAYSVGCGGGWTMANGDKVHVGAIAMNGIRFGTRVRVTRSPTGLRWHTVEDRHAPGSTGLDFWVRSCWLARAWGRRVVRVTY